MDTVTVTKSDLLNRIGSAIRALEPGAEVILYGSRARGDDTASSDWDLLVLLDGLVDDERCDRLRHRLYEVEWDSGEVISSIIVNRENWRSPKYRVSPLSVAVERDGIAI